ncbi:MAG: DUF3604 domain-containing protein, partial [Eudoraea sp.]|uniref:DUF3604 domain-containing protein n=1 Tax=Eudoraea sp. TaxID=1979955 RepID=UPI003C7520C6
MEPSKERASHVFMQSPPGTIYASETIASGYAAVWAKSNIRKDLFGTITRKETYATAGSRIKLRFFGGSDFTKADLAENYVEIGYKRGVPMEGNLTPPTSEAPSFLLHALMDPETGNLDRMQLVKGWVNEDDSLDEKVYDVAWSGERKPDDKSKVPSVGNSVDLDNATWSNDIGATELKIIWTDPNFDPAKES